jgi:hypothetical protein
LRLTVWPLADGAAAANVTMTIRMRLRESNGLTSWDQSVTGIVSPPFDFSSAHAEGHSIGFRRINRQNSYSRLNVHVTGANCHNSSLRWHLFD